MSLPATQQRGHQTGAAHTLRRLSPDIFAEGTRPAQVLHALCHCVLPHLQTQQVPGSPGAGAPHGFPGASPRRASEGSTASLTGRCSELSSHGTPARSIGLSSSTGVSGVNIRDMVAPARSPPAPDQVSCWLLPCSSGAACFAVVIKVQAGPLHAVR